MKKQIYVSIGIALIVIIGGLVWFRNTPNPETGGGSLLEENVAVGYVATTTEEKGSQTPGTTSLQDTTAQTPSVSAPIPVPNLNRSVAGFSASEASIETIQKLTGELAQNQELLTSWLLLGIARKGIGDYAGAEEIWTFVTKKWPSDYVAYNNLGDLYKEYLKDYPKAEKAFQTVIAKNPAYIPGYVNLSDLYRFFYKEKSAEVVPVLEQGLKANPENIELMLRIARYYADTGTSPEKAMEYYQMTIDESKNAGETDFASRIQKEMDELKGQ